MSESGEFRYCLTCVVRRPTLATTYKVRATFEYGHAVFRRLDQLNDLTLVTDWNWSCAERGAGSEIFYTTLWDTTESRPLKLDGSFSE